MAVLWVSVSAFAYDFEADGIYYNILSIEDLTCEVTYNPSNMHEELIWFNYGDFMYNLTRTYPSYSGDVVVPPTVNYKGRVLSVIGIGEYAFLNCKDLRSLTLPSSITQIKEVLPCQYRESHTGAFDYCNIETFTVGNAYTLKMFNQCHASKDNKGYRTRENLKNLVLTDDFFGIIEISLKDYKNLVSIRSNAIDVPAFTASAFSDKQYIHMLIEVPKLVVDKYKESEYWSEFWKIRIAEDECVPVTSIPTEDQPDFSKGQFQYRILSRHDLTCELYKYLKENVNLTTVELPAKVTYLDKDLSVVSAVSTAFSNSPVDRLILPNTYSGSEISNVRILRVASAHSLGAITGDTKVLEFSKDFEGAISKVFVSIELDSLISYAAIPPEFTGDRHFSNAQCLELDVFVPEETYSQYQNADVWKNFWDLMPIKQVRTITLNESSLNLWPDQTFQLLPTIAPDDAFNSSVIWASSDTDVATVDGTGRVLAHGKGDAIISASSVDGGEVVANCTVHVDFVAAETMVIDGICYQRNTPSTLKIVANSENPYSGNFIIPTSADFNGQNMEVTQIGADAFAGCENLTSIVIPSTVERISPTSFTGCTKLKYVKISNGSTVSCDIDSVFPDSPITELYVGSADITYGEKSRIARNLVGLTLGNSVNTFPLSVVFKNLKYFVVEDGDIPIVEPQDYCSNSQSLITQQSIVDSQTHVYFRFFYLITYTHLAPVLKALQENVLDYVHIGREVKTVDVDMSKTQERIPTTAGSRYQEYGYFDEVNYQYNEIIAKSDYNRFIIETIVFEKEEIGLQIGESIKLITALTPENAAYTTLNWTSSDENIASVDIFGNVTKLAEGEAMITATTTDGSNLSAQCKIKDAEDGISNVVIDNGLLVDVYNFQGVIVRSKCMVEDLQNLPSGIYIIRQGDQTEKITVR